MAILTDEQKAKLINLEGLSTFYDELKKENEPIVTKVSQLDNVLADKDKALVANGDGTASWQEIESGTEVLVYTLAEYELIKDTIPIGSQFIIIDDYQEGGVGGATTLSALSDVILNDVQDGNVLTYSEELQAWTNGKGKTPEPDGLVIETWLQKARWTGVAYSTLDEVLADEKCIRQLITVHDSVDYMLECLSKNLEQARTILNNDLVAKWITLRDYALDTLHGEPSTTYTNHVPDMTSYTEPSGVVAESSRDGSNFGWYAFSSNPSGWTTYWNQLGWLSYEFSSATTIDSIGFIANYLDYPGDSYNVTIQTSADGSVWTDIITTDVGYSSSLTDVVYIDFPTSYNNKYYKIIYNTFNMRTSYAGGSNYCYAHRILLCTKDSDTLTPLAPIMDAIGKYGYGEWALMPQVPKMTSNTAPYGTVIYNQTYEGSEWRAFDGDGSTWGTAKFVNKVSWYGYTFTEPKCVKQYTLKNNKFSGTYQLQGCNGDVTIESNWENIEQTPNVITTATDTYTFYVNNDKKYLSYRLRTTTTTSDNGVAFALLQFYAWQPKGLVPIMTSNTSPYGEAMASSALNATFDIYHAFEPSSQYHSFAGGEAVGPNSGWLGYTFKSPACVTRVTVSGGPQIGTAKYLVEASNDNVNWVIVSPETSLLPGSSISFSNTNYYMSYRVRISYTSQPYIHLAGNYNCSFDVIQFYGRQLKVSVPTMTSDTEPWGECFSSPTYSDPCFHAFSGPSGFSVLSPGSNNYWGYKFNKPVFIKKSLFKSAAGASGYLTFQYKIQASYDGISWNDITDVITHQNVPGTYSIVDLNTDKEYMYYRFYCVTHTQPDNGDITAWINFYGIDYSEREFEPNSSMKYIYDHGVEIGELSATGSGGYLERHNDCILIVDNSTSQNFGITTQGINTTLFNVARASFGNDIVLNASSELYCGSAQTTIIRESLPFNVGLNIVNVNGNNVNKITSGGVSSVGRLELTEWWLE